MRDIERDDRELMLQVLQLGAHVDAQAGIEVRERLIHQERLRMTNDGAGEGDALPLASGKLARQILQQMREPKTRCDLVLLRAEISAGGRGAALAAESRCSAATVM